MIKGTKLFIILLLISRAGLFAQHLSHQVLVPAAGIAVTNTVSYQQTVGETAIEIIGHSGFVFTQGFQQPGVKITPDVVYNGNGVEVYPNPATDFIEIKLFGDEARKFNIDVISMAGTIINSGSIEFIEKYYYLQRVEVDQFKPGFYFVRVVSTDGKIRRTFKIEKM
jgi:hypothetical protein